MTRRTDDPLVIDADAHILEPPDLWQRYIDPAFRDRPICIKTDARGLEYLEIDGKMSKRNSGGMLFTVGGYGKSPQELMPRPDRTYADTAPLGAMDPRERLTYMDQEGVDASVLYPSLALLWEPEVFDAALCDAYCRAYNRWIVDFCADSADRLIPIAHISLGDVERAVAELERSVRDGVRGAFVAPHTISRIPHGHPDHDPFWAKAAELGVPIGIHPTIEPNPPMAAAHFDGMRGQSWYFTVMSSLAVQAAFTTLFQYGTFERFPDLKLIVLESSGGWISAWLERMDAKYESIGRFTRKMTRPPSQLFKAQCWISCDPDEKTVPAIIDLVGDDRFFWASDYPHSEAKPGVMDDLRDMAGLLKPEARAKLLGGNVAALYDITGRRTPAKQ